MEKERRESKEVNVGINTGKENVSRYDVDENGYEVLHFNQRGLFGFGDEDDFEDFGVGYTDSRYELRKYDRVLAKVIFIPLMVISIPSLIFLIPALVLFIIGLGIYKLLGGREW